MGRPAPKDQIPRDQSPAAGLRLLALRCDCLRFASRRRSLEPRDGWAVLTKLRDWATQPPFVYTHKWKVGDFLLWDNTGTMHRADSYALDSNRLMHRTTMGGAVPA